MKKHLIVLPFIVSTFSSLATPLISHDKVSNQLNCFSQVFSDYSSWRGEMKKKIEKRATSEEAVNKRLASFDNMFGEAKFNRFKQNLDCQTFEYQVDAHKVKGYVVKPKNSDKKLPVLVYNRGGNGNYGGVVFGSMMFNLFPIAEAGFVIVGSQYRGTFTRSDSLDEFGGRDVKDVTTLLDIIPSIENADASRIGMYGGSRGGMQTHLAVKESSDIKAIATIAGASDLAQGLVERPEMERVYQLRIPNYSKNKEKELTKRSVLKWADRLSKDVPILLLHGTADTRVAVNQSEELAKALSKNNIPHKLVLYPNGQHSLINEREQVNQELIKWFNRYL